MLKEIIERYKFIFHNQVYVTRDSQTALCMHKDWINIDDIRLGRISPWGNTYYAFDKNRAKRSHARNMSTEYFLVYDRLVLTPYEYLMIRAFKIYGRKKINKEFTVFTLTLLFSWLLLSIIGYMLIA